MIELIDRVDPLTALVLIGFWARWELWGFRHRQLHAELAQLLQHEVHSHA